MRVIDRLGMGFAAVVTLALSGVTLAQATAGTGDVVASIDGQWVGPVQTWPGEDGIVADPSAPLRLRLGADMGAAWADWLQQSSQQGLVERDLDIVVAAGTPYKVAASGAMIGSVTVPKLDGSSKDAAYFDLEFEAEQVHSGKAAALSPASVVADSPVQPLSRSDFEVDLGDLPCSRISSVESFTWRQEVPKDPMGKFIQPPSPGASILPTSLTLTLDATDVPAWIAWRDQFAEDAVEKTGALRIFSADGATHAEFALFGVGILAVTPAPAAMEKIARFEVELYVEKMEFKLHDADPLK